MVACVLDLRHSRCILVFRHVQILRELVEDLFGISISPNSLRLPSWASSIVHYGFSLSLPRFRSNPRCSCLL
ncbi:hypothetical protein BVRB_039930 [Beta vulgaris subsp. vulgaris]|uniref:Uncharacterized protein n=1 Tax=Beta vulgaris subsp. vulgaris TaxID=3555 RepID=A0A0J7YN92_BETVV|nr:hypothetical protein BVRB_039930 [Beta vulgaris subsp. vulgaris]